MCLFWICPAYISPVFIIASGFLLLFWNPDDCSHSPSPSCRTGSTTVAIFKKVASRNLSLVDQSQLQKFTSRADENKSAQHSNLKRAIPGSVIAVNSESVSGAKKSLLIELMHHPHNMQYFFLVLSGTHVSVFSPSSVGVFVMCMWRFVSQLSVVYDRVGTNVSMTMFM